MPPRVARLPSGRATVNQNHPAATAAAAAARVVAAGKINGGKSPLLNPVIHPRAPQRRWRTKKLVKFVIITPAPPLRWRPPTMPKLRPVSRLISLPKLPPASLFSTLSYLPRTLSWRHSHPCGTRGGVAHVPPYTLLVTVGS
jgi:hypothetical protein